MKNIVAVLLFLILSVSVSGQTVCLYDTWKSILENKGDTVGNLKVTKYKKGSSYNVECINKDKELSKRLKEHIIAVKYGDTLLLSSDYANRRLSELSCFISLYGYMPLYASDKIMYFYHTNNAVSLSNSFKIGLMGMVTGLAGGLYLYSGTTDKGSYFIIDLKKKDVIPVDFDELSKLASNYPEITKPFDKTKKYRKRIEVVNHYFKEYVKAIHSDSTFQVTHFVEPPKENDK